MVGVRWLDGVVRCPTCGSDKVVYMENAKLYNCKVRHPKQKFSLKVGTIFEDSPIGLEKWLPAVWLINISLMEMARFRARSWAEAHPGAAPRTASKSKGR